MKTRILALAILGIASSAWAAGDTNTDPSALPEMKIIGVREHPALVERVLPEYPHEALRAGAEGRVSLSMKVDSAGRVTAVKVLDSDNRILSDVAVAAVRRWRFVSAAPRQATVTFKFEIVPAATAAG